MEKTKLGVSVGMLGAAVFFSALFGGYIPALIVAGYILLCEENAWLKKAAVKSVALLMAFSVAIYLIDLIPDVLGWLTSFLSVIGLNISLSFIYSIVNLLTSALSIVKTVAFLLLGLKALKQETIAISSLDDLVDTHMGLKKAEPAAKPVAEVKAEAEEKAE